MSTMSFASLIEELTGQARQASIAEQEFDREIARRRAEVEETRAFAWRRVNLLRAIASSVAGIEDTEEAGEAGRRSFYREVGWNGATQNQRDVAERFAPVLEAIHAAMAGEEADARPVVESFSEFESWYAETRGAPFLSLMQREIVELPLVEV